MIGKRLEVEFERIVPEGKVVGSSNGLNVYVLGAFPGERAVVEVFRRKKRFAEARVVELLTRSAHRIEPEESHYMSCSPWQVIDYDYQIQLKKEMLLRCFNNIAYEDLELNDFWASPIQQGYRTKMEYSLAEFDGKLSLAFYHRGEHFKQIALEKGCMLGSQKANEEVLKIVDYLNEIHFPTEPLLGITVRESKTTDTKVCMLLLTTRNLTEEQMRQIHDVPTENFICAYISPDSSVRLVNDVIYQKGVTSIEEKVLDLSISYPYDGFFQNNIPGIEAAICHMQEYVFPCEQIVELYSGVGTLGLHFADKAKSVTGIEIGEWAAEWAEKNALANKIYNYSTKIAQAERTQQDLIAQADILVLDPPRPGLHKKVIRMIRETTPKRIIYLSCNPITQARDYGVLKDLYNVTHLSGYDFYPNTVHVESLLVLDRKN